MIRLIFPLRRAPFVTQEFGANPQIYSQYKIDGVPLKGHEGIDFRAEMGTEVVASDSGFAQEVKDQGSTGYGKYIKLIHEWGETVYAHLKSFNIKQGDQVSRGQTIALSDNTGNSTGPHLHYGVRVNPYNRKDGWGGYIDPAPLLFSGESSEGLPVWLRNFLSEKQIDIGQAEPTIRDWCDKASLYSAEKEKNGHLKEDIGKIYDAVGLNDSKPIGDVVKKISLWQDGYLREDGTAKDYRLFVEKIATRIKCTKTDPKAVLMAFLTFCVDASEPVLTGLEHIIIGLKLILKIKGGEKIEENKPE